MICESIGRIHEINEIIMDSLYQMRGTRCGFRMGSSKNQIRARISMDLKYGVHFACCLQWANMESQFNK